MNRETHMSYRITSDCEQCGLCRKICPTGAIVKTGERYAIVADKCKSCGTCAAKCPKGAIAFVEDTARFEPAPSRRNPLQHGGFSRGYFHHAGHGRAHGNRFMDWIERLLRQGGGSREKPGRRARGERSPGRCGSRRPGCRGRGGRLMQHRINL